MASVYVGTYRKYNEGSLKGAWLNLDDYSTYGEFVKKCREVHSDERDPELMIQDSEGFPDGLDCMEWISESDFNDVKLAMREEQGEQKPSISIVDYSDKAFAVVGDTKSVKDELKKMGGRFNSKLSCGAGWIFPNKSREDVKRFISSGEVAERTRNERRASTGSQFVTWLDEYVSASGNESARKYHLGAVRIGDGYYLIEKPSIKNRFCFHDEGPDYEFYKSLMADDKKLQGYFKSENLATFDNKISKITKGEYGDKRVWKNPCYNDGRLEVCFYSSWGTPDGYTECSDDEKALILKGLKFGRELYEKRLDAYLKRYGTSKLHTWTYWADA